MKLIRSEERLALGLGLRGFTETTPTARYRVFIMEGKPTFYVGKAGALRVSKTGRVTLATVASGRTRLWVLEGTPTHIHRGQLFMPTHESVIEWAELHHGAN